MPRKVNDPEVVGAALAAQFSNELGFVPGNLWEPPISRAIIDDLKQYDQATVEQHWRTQLGLAKRTA